MEKIIFFLLFINSIMIAITKAINNLNKLLDSYIEFRLKIDKIKEHPNGNSDAHED